jgi:hypothetical protein
MFARGQNRTFSFPHLSLPSPLRNKARVVQTSSTGVLIDRKPSSYGVQIRSFHTNRSVSLALDCDGRDGRSGEPERDDDRRRPAACMQQFVLSHGIIHLYTQVARKPFTFDLACALRDTDIDLGIIICNSTDFYYY